MDKNQLLQKFDYFYVTRPMLFFPGWNTLLAGFLAGAGQLEIFSDLPGPNYQIYLIPEVVVLAMFAFMLAMGGAFIVNQIKDVASDRENRKLFLIGEGFISPRAAKRESFILLLAALISSLWIGEAYFVLILLFILISTYFYNFKPFLFKNRPVAGLLSNMTGGWIAFSLGWVLTSPLNLDYLLHGLPYLLLNTGLIFLTTTPDAQGDRAARKETFCVKYGVRPTVQVGGILYLISLITAIWLNDQFMMVITVPLLYFFLRMLHRPSVTGAVRFLKFAILLFSMAICLKFPLYFIPMVTVFLFTRYYYRRRFEFDYPNFSGN